MKTPKQLERYCKGAANHWRIAIVQAVYKREGMALEDIAQELKGNFKTISQHTRALVQAGLLQKSTSAAKLHTRSRHTAKNSTPS